MICEKEAKAYIMASYPNDPLLKHIAINMLDTLPKVEQIQCKDCKHYVWDEFDGCYACLRLGRFVKPDFWCAYRERRTDGN